jgi:polar amino acid transport system permease protein
LFLTLELTAFAMLIGIVLGVIIAIMRLSHSRLMSGTAWVYTWFFRGTPVLVQLIFWFNIAVLFPAITLGVPFFHVTFLHINDNAVFTPLFSGIVALGLNEAAYFSEIARYGPGPDTAPYSAAPGHAGDPADHWQRSHFDVKNDLLG